MKKIDKSSCLATEYFAWQSTTQAKYYSSHKYYQDVLVSLINCQDGLCAYTEFRLIDENDVKNFSKSFTTGRYNGQKPKAPIDIEHFDSQKKKKKGWSWDNLFGVEPYVNRKIKRVREAELLKQNREINPILKPDSTGYDPNIYLKYDSDIHSFYPNPELDNKLISEVKDMINVLGLNCSFIKMKRKEYVLGILLEKKFLGQYKIHQFITACKFLNL